MDIEKIPEIELTEVTPEEAEKLKKEMYKDLIILAKLHIQNVKTVSEVEKKGNNYILKEFKTEKKQYEKLLNRTKNNEYRISLNEIINLYEHEIKQLN